MCMHLVFNLNGSTTYQDVAIVALFSSNLALVAAASTRPGHMAKRAEKSKFDRYPHTNLVPFILETTCRPGQHARQFISNLMKDADNLPLALRDTWSAIQSVLHSPSPNNNFQLPLRDLRAAFCHTLSCFSLSPRYVKCRYRPYGNTCRGFSFKLAPALPCGLAVTTLLPMTTSTTPAMLSYSWLLTPTIAPALLAGLSEVDELMIALGCRFALDIFTIAQQDPPPPVPGPLPHDPGFAHWF